MKVNSRRAFYVYKAGKVGKAGNSTFPRLRIWQSYPLLLPAFLSQWVTFRAKNTQNARVLLVFFRVTRFTRFSPYRRPVTNLLFVELPAFPFLPTKAGNKSG